LLLLVSCWRDGLFDVRYEDFPAPLGGWEISLDIENFLLYVLEIFNQLCDQTLGPICLKPFGHTGLVPVIFFVDAPRAQVTVTFGAGKAVIFAFEGL
jgi:hypothetical protein